MFKLDNLPDVILIASEDCCLVQHFLKSGSLCVAERVVDLRCQCDSCNCNGRRLTNVVISDDCVGDVDRRDNCECALRLFSAELDVKASEVSQVNTDETIGCESFEHVDIDSVEVTVDADGQSDGAKSARFAIDMLERNRAIDIPGETESFGDCSGNGSDGRSCVEQSNNMTIVDCEIDVNEFRSSDDQIGRCRLIGTSRCLC